MLSSTFDMSVNKITTTPRIINVLFIDQSEDLPISGYIIAIDNVANIDTIDITVARLFDGIYL